jgi:NADPH2:quinone reductase
MRMIVTMQAIEVAEIGGPEVLSYVERPQPSPGPGEVLIKAEAIGVNFIETYFRSGTYPRDLPFVLGTTAPAQLVALVPSDVGLDVAASALLKGMTAHYLITSVYPVQSGDAVLVHAGAGGVGLILTQWATNLGVRVITTVSTPAKAELSRQAGATDVLDYPGDDAAGFGGRIRELTDGAGVAAVFDGVGASTFDASLASLAVRGTLALFGASSGPVPPVDPQRLNAAGSVYLTRPTLAHFTRTGEEFAWRSGELFAAIADGSLSVTVSRSYPLAEAAQAHRDLEGRQTVGSIVLTP